MVPTVAADGSTVWTPAGATCPVSGLIADHLLPPLDFSHAIPRYISSLEQWGWEQSHILMLANLFGALITHDYWTSDDAFEQRALLSYQEEQRRAWHQAIPQPNGAWNLAIIDEAALSRTYDRICCADHICATAEFDLKVHSFLPSTNLITHTNLAFLPTFPHTVYCSHLYSVLPILHFALCIYSSCVLCHVFASWVFAPFLSTLLVFGESFLLCYPR